MFDFLFATAQAQEAAAGVQNPIMQFAPFIFIFIIFYFLMIKPQKKRLEQEQAMLSSLNKGDEVYTKSGIIGTITGLTEKIVTLEVSEGVKMKILRAQVGGPAQKLFEKTEASKK